MSLPKISLIIPAFNEEKTLPACLASLTEADYPKELVEIIVVDNGSTDGTRRIAKSHGAILMCDASRKVAGLRNIGARIASGELLAFVDADCIVNSKWLRQAAVYYKQNDVAVWGAPPEIPDNPTWVQKAWYLVREKSSQVKDVDWLESMNLFVRRRDFAKVEGFNEYLETCEDVDFCYRLAKHGRIVSDRNIQVVHLGEAATLNEFIKKEIWRGKSNLAGLFKHGIFWRELPSLFIPVYFALFAPLAAGLALINFNLVSLLLFLFFYLAPTMLVIVKLLMQSLRPSLKQYLHLLILLQAYFWSRTLAVLR
jgi:glycosyltransferase involved in cell wall biosynthesis